MEKSTYSNNTRKRYQAGLVGNWSVTADRTGDEFRYDDDPPADAERQGLLAQWLEARRSGGGR